MCSNRLGKHRTTEETVTTPFHGSLVRRDCFSGKRKGQIELFDKCWWDNIYRPVFVKILIDGIENGYIEKYPQDDFDYENKNDFDDICDTYSDDIELEHSKSCICKIPDWVKE